MNEKILKLINANNIINQKLPAIIEAFITFYGENHRERIIDKFKNMQIICHIKVKCL